jgi:hypothetical protein
MSESFPELISKPCIFIIFGRLRLTQRKKTCGPITEADECKV